MQTSNTKVIKNKKANFEYFILSTFEAGLVLVGSEVKGIRAGRCNLKDSFIRIINGEAWVFNMHITYSATTNRYFMPDEKRARKLLLHKREIDKLFGQVSTKGLALVPLQIHFSKRGKAKMLFGLARGKKEYDKRETLKKKTLDKEAAQAMKEYK
ncbi:SsrA-binding protein [Helicobacter sp. 13S00401-1]|uniref:SsrA-binding protein SmpB n=1 Tax=Helicobacter sp. 13S00401-1 TaxID=1905758 RepID=UPI000BA6223A|nr:SsrA-binding protein SmpB [Helicobacter sp. 13S00401-1]PAF51332.1 SsrA-binding protein [Helicobacter sp. 13S00401-1]